PRKRWRRFVPVACPWTARQSRVSRSSSRAPLDGSEQSFGVDGSADGGHLARRADMGEQPIIAATASNLARVTLSPDLDLEDEARIIFEAPPELGGEGRLAKIDSTLL